MHCASRSLLFPFPSSLILLFPLSPFIPIQEMKEMFREELDINSPELMSAEQESGETATSTTLQDTEHKQQQGKTEDQKSTHHSSKRSKKRTTRAARKLKKIYADRWVKHLWGMLRAVKFSVYLLKAKIQILHSLTARVHQSLSGRSSSKDSSGVLHREFGSGLCLPLGLPNAAVYFEWSYKTLAPW